MSDFSNSDDIIDSRDVVNRIEELESLKSDVSDAQEARDEAETALDEAQSEYEDWDSYSDSDEAETELGKREATAQTVRDAQEALDEAESALDVEKGYFGEDEADELETLAALQDEAEGYCSDWHHGATLIRHSHFQEYAQELAEDIGAINSDASWPNDHIDWEAAARTLKMDYTEVDFDGIPYLVR